MSNVFIVAPNNSGSTMLHNLIATSSQVSILPDEGQYCWGGGHGPAPLPLGVKHIFALKESVFTNEDSYDWINIKREWNKLWDQTKPILLEKSPPNVVRVDMLKREFPDCKLIFMMRNPYAIVEGIMRGNPEATLWQATAHTARIMEVQKRNIERNPDSLKFKYEDLTEYPAEITKEIENYLGIDDIKWQGDITVKSYSTSIRNMNDQQISQLSTFQRGRMLELFYPKIDVFDFFEYTIL